MSRYLLKFLNKLRDSVNQSSSIRNFCSAPKMKEGRIHVDGININCVRVGVDQHPVLLLPGVLGTCWTDFKPQIENLSKDEFKIVAWDPPGYGKSRPPDRTFPDDFFERDANWGYKLMKTLGYSTFSLVGWSDGGITSLILAAKYPKNIRKLVVVGTNAFVFPHELRVYESIRNIDCWSAKMRDPLLAIYGENYFRKTWELWVNTMRKFVDENNGDICKDYLKKIECSTLILHGKKDKMVDGEHSEYLNKNIENSQVKVFEEGAHNLHLQYPEEFNRLITEFLIENSNIKKKSISNKNEG